MPRLFYVLGLAGIVGCAGNPSMVRHTQRPSRQIAVAQPSSPVIASSNGDRSVHSEHSPVHVSPVETALVGYQNDDGFMLVPPRPELIAPAPEPELDAEMVPPAPEPELDAEIVPPAPKPEKDDADGKRREVEDIPVGAAEREEEEPTQNEGDDSVASAPDWEPSVTSDVANEMSSLGNAVPLNLPSALAMIDSGHPAVGMVQWRVQEAYARLAQAEALWLPSIRAGISVHRHDGNYQASNGDIVDVNRNSLQYGLGTGATGAGTTPRPGLLAQFHLADAIFQPEIAEKTAWARGHAAKATVNRQMLQVATAYYNLLDAYQTTSILDESIQRTRELTKVTRDFAEAGEGLQADAERMETETVLLASRRIAAQESVAVASARLSQALSFDVRQDIVPLDLTVVPIDSFMVDSDKASLISTGLTMRPELKESQALVAAACEAYQREKYAPLVPSVLLGFSTGGFGGGLGPDPDQTDSRYDFDAAVSWEIRNLGYGDRAARRQSSARVQQAKYEKLQVMDQVAREVSEAASQVEFRRQQIEITRRAIGSAQRSYDLNRSRIADGQGLPIEVLQSVQALESARLAYLGAVIDHNQSQFQLQWALGYPIQ